MIEVRKAQLSDVEGIIKVCTEGYRVAQVANVERAEPDYLVKETIDKYYNSERIRGEITNISQEWNGWFVAVDKGEVVGAGGGGFTAEKVSELYVLYLHINRKREGIGSKLLSAITQEQIERGSKEQWVSVAKGNMLGIPFYEAVGFQFQKEQPAFDMPKEEGFMSLRYRRYLD